MKGKLITSLVATLVVVAAAIGYLASGATPQLGLDLKGGISAVLTPVLEPGQTVDDEVLDQTIAVIRQRVDSLGVAEPEISRQGDDVLIQLPGLQDEDRARQIIGRTAKLTFRLVEGIVSPGTAEYDASPECAETEDINDSDTGVICGPADEGVAARDGNGVVVVDEQGLPVVQPLKYNVGPAILSGADIKDALPVFGSSGWGTELQFKGGAADTFTQITADLACQRDAGELDNFAIVLDGVVESAPGMNNSIVCGVGITGGTAFIASGGGLDPDAQQQEASDLSIVLKTGSLPITLEPSTFERVSPTLGSKSLRNGLIAGGIGLLIVALYLLFFYRILGFVAIGALLIFGVYSIGLITLLGRVGFTLTLAGIAGIIVSIGITADSSIIYFERLRDEVSSGRTMRTSVRRAFESAFRTNLTGNTVTLAAAVVLYFLAVGPVRGFALMLGASTILDIIILYFYTRPMVQLLGQTTKLNARSVRATVVTPEGAPS